MRWNRYLGRLTRKQAGLIFLAALFVYGLVSYDRVLKPTPHLHFVDLANTFLNGDLETKTPTRRCLSKPRKGAPPGYNQFICGATKGGKEGWNDWSSYHLITTKSRCSHSLKVCSPALSCPGDETCVPGERYKGVWPWGDTKGSDRHLFRTLDGTIYVIDRTEDVHRDERKYYVSFPPMPAVLMMPFVAAVKYNFNDVLFTLLFAAANVLLMLILLERLTALGKNNRALRENIMLAILVGFGTSLFFSSVRGEVWFTALVIGFFFNVLFICFSLEARHPLLAGLMLAFGMATRTPLAFACVFFAVELLRTPGWGVRGRKGLWFSAPILVVGGLLMAYNMARFDSPFEFGHTFLQDGQRPSVRNHGLFHFRFLNRNLSAALTNFPVFSENAPHVLVNRHGLGIFVVTPAFLLLLWPRQWKPVMTSAMAAIVAVGLPGFFYQNTGWAQFSYRFSIDFLPYMAVLLACGAQPLNRSFKVLIAASVLICLFGAITFGRFGDVFYYG
jgi:hypothetical protein